MTARLILLLLLILVAVVIVVVVLRRGSAQRDAHRVEAAKLRSEADTLAAGLAGQSAFADQSAERAEVARAEAEERAREAARLEAEAAEHRAALEATQRDYEATMRRADDIDPDVKESKYPAVTETEGGHGEAAATAPDAGMHERGDVAGADHGDHGGSPEGDVPMTRAERREAREAGGTDGGAGAAPAAASSAPAAGAAGAAAAGASAWAARGDDHPHDRSGEESERIASAADFRDDVPAEPTEVYGAPERGSEPHMSDNSSTETTRHPGNDDGLGAGGTGAAATGDAAHVTDHRDRESGDTARVDTDGADRTTEDAPAAMTIIGEPEAYATTEPVMASEQTAPVSPDEADAGIAQHNGDAGAAVAETDGTHRSAADVAEQSTDERYDPTPTRDWAADEGELLEQNSDRGDRLEAERSDLAHEAGDATPATASDSGDTHPASGAGDPATAAGDGTASAGRRISAFEEIRDGGFGVGSAAPLDGGAQPLDHPVQGFHDMTYRAPGDAGYDAAEPDVWFYDEGAAQRSGFRRADG